MECSQRGLNSVGMLIVLAGVAGLGDLIGRGAGWGKGEISGGGGLFKKKKRRTLTCLYETGIGPTFDTLISSPGQPGIIGSSCCSWPSSAPFSCYRMSVNRMYVIGAAVSVISGKDLDRALRLSREHEDDSGPKWCAVLLVVYELHLFHCGVTFKQGLLGLLGCFFFFFQAEDGIRDYKVTGVQTCALPI